MTQFLLKVLQFKENNFKEIHRNFIKEKAIKSNTSTLRGMIPLKEMIIAKIINCHS